MKLTKNLFHETQRIFLTYQNSVYLVLIILLGAVLRVYDLGAESFWFDEIYTIHLVSQDLPTLIQWITTEESVTRHAVYFLSAHFWGGLPSGISEVSIRSLSVIFGVLSIGMMYLVGRQLFGENVGLISSFLMAVSEFQIYHSQEAKYYSLLVLLTLCSLYFYIRMLKTKKPRFWIFFSIFNILLFYTHTTAIFVFAAEYIHYFLYWKHHKKTLVEWCLSQIFLFLTIIPSFILLNRTGKLTANFSSDFGFLTTPSLKDLLSAIYNYLFPQNFQHSWFFIAASFAAGLAFFVLGAFIFNLRKEKNHWLTVIKSWFRNLRIPSKKSSKYTLVALWFICPILLPFIYSIIFTPFFLGRYTISAAPAFFLMIAIAISQIRRIVPVYITLIALMIVIIPGLQDYYSADVNEQWREAAAYVHNNTQASDLIVFAPNQDGRSQKIFDWYYHGTIPACSISSQIKDDHKMADALSNCTLGHERYWVIIRGTPEVVNRMKSFFLNPDKTIFHLTKEQEFVMVSVYLFELKK